MTNKSIRPWWTLPGNGNLSLDDRFIASVLTFFVPLPLARSTAQIHAEKKGRAGMGADSGDLTSADKKRPPMFSIWNRFS